MNTLCIIAAILAMLGITFWAICFKLEQRTK